MRHVFEASFNREIFCWVWLQYFSGRNSPHRIPPISPRTPPVSRSVVRRSVNHVLPPVPPPPLIYRHFCKVQSPPLSVFLQSRHTPPQYLTIPLLLGYATFSQAFPSHPRRQDSKFLPSFSTIRVTAKTFETCPGVQDHTCSENVNQKWHEDALYPGL